MENTRTIEEKTLEAEECNWYLLGVEEPKKNWSDEKFDRVTEQMYCILHKLREDMLKKERWNATFSRKTLKCIFHKDVIRLTVLITRRT